ncbi:MAG: methenyltetrahydromethanopterin cyclohydrolase [Candidatus Bathyarchaeota archaeon]|nr:methenyltetrahydromethanopterin cyclohydrolase [Candidatus Bathyarchaeota archaeon]
MIPSVNSGAIKIVREICERPEKYNVVVKKSCLGACIIDAGVKARGGFSVGRLIIEICLGGLGEAQLSLMRLGELDVPAVNVYTDHPSISTLGSQMAGWRIKVGEYIAMGSGPARALAEKPKNIYEKIKYRDESNEAIIVLESSKEPPEEAVKMIAEACRISPENLFIVVTSTSSIAGLTQVSGRVVEVGMYKLTELGLDPSVVSYAFGQAPIPPPCPDLIESMGKSNDVILYGGSTYYVVRYDDDDYLREIADEAVSSSSKDYGKTFVEIFTEAGQDFYKIDPKIFAPAKITIVNEKTGKTFAAGRINVDLLMKSIGYHR